MKFGVVPKENLFWHYIRPSFFGNKRIAIFVLY
jgi:hypothetical protein